MNAALGDEVEVLSILHDRPKGALDRGPVEQIDTQELERRDPVDRLGDPGWLLHIEGPQPCNRSGDVLGQVRACGRYSPADDRSGPGDVGVVDPVIEASALKGVVEIAGAVGRNTGTWIRLMRFTPEMLATEAAFAEVYKVLADGRMKAIDAGVPGGPPLVLDRTSAVSICAGADGVTGALLHVVGDGTGEPDVVKSFKRP